ncbi:hypothetical protein BLS_008577 [Venturia inaequalis]|uniref:DUF1909-domain-containing protein n=1 Tax=Venturia inaequalis TaxID=5025 RepID=A0A8H3VMP1_VENIN|nr:hypothetical protein BLS_008577 [Venturia inaequalis]KAE9969353.1 hypothetical protein EG328_006943 [Venturia inaequalis]KAE9990232.1 hypothetical protein EG327_001659 [Venturia inaequalis]RDI79299.1 DNA-directed RNA polymerase III subunit [Venturia inaequalis]
MGNGAKAQQKRERNAKDAKGGASSQLKTNAAAKNIICKVCRQDFQCTVKRPQLEVHATDKHDKTYEDCFAA